jgi:hypothetical protein
MPYTTRLEVLQVDELENKVILVKNLVGAVVLRDKALW